jgi:hypothetical protein
LGPFRACFGFGAHRANLGSCHCIKGSIYGFIRKYYEQNSRYDDFGQMTKLLFKRHIARGWNPDLLIKPIFASAEKKIKSELASRMIPRNFPPPNNVITNNRTQQFLHLTFHPNGIPRHKIREIYKQECEETFSRELGISKLTIAYSCPSNIQSIIAKAKIFEVKGNKVSKHFTGEPN